MMIDNQPELSPAILTTLVLYKAHFLNFWNDCFILFKPLKLSDVYIYIYSQQLT